MLSENDLRTIHTPYGTIFKDRTSDLLDDNAEKSLESAAAGLAYLIEIAKRE